MLWLLIVLFAPIGVAAGWSRDRLVTSLLIGFVLPTAAALAVTNGNVGTLLRLRGLVSPYRDLGGGGRRPERGRVSPRSPRRRSARSGRGLDDGIDRSRRTRLRTIQPD